MTVSVNIEVGSRAAALVVPKEGRARSGSQPPVVYVLRAVASPSSASKSVATECFVEIEQVLSTEEQVVLQNRNDPARRSVGAAQLATGG